VDNSLEISIFGDAKALAKDFDKDLCPSIEISSDIYRALQVDNGMYTHAHTQKSRAKPEAQFSIFNKSFLPLSPLLLLDGVLSLPPSSGSIG
jgi:hypothetical protein